MPSPFSTFQLAVSSLKSNYCCGGVIPPPAHEDSEPAIAITLRWDLNEPKPSYTSLKLDFPVMPTDAFCFDELLKACAPATYRLGGRDVLDETYRKAGKLDPHQFATDFHPHDFGIVDAVAQVLLPHARPGILQERKEHRGVLAELYELNIYSGPAGKSQAHVDTPRDTTHFGSLVICLPYPHEGGALRVSHKGRDTHFDWSTQSSGAIQWAAFYNDCEYEVLPVTSGHRITLTYNLYIIEQTGAILRPNPLLDIAMSPLYSPAKSMLEDVSFMARGGTIGFWCTQRYAHTRTGINKMMPYMLKGLDMVIYSMFKTLGMGVRVRPVLEVDEDKLRDYYEDRYEAWDSDDDSSDNYVAHIDGEMVLKDFVGTEMHELVLTGEYDESFELEAIIDAFPLNPELVRWISGRQIHEIAIAKIAHGNPEMAHNCSSAAILVTIPPIAQRVVAGTKVCKDAPTLESGQNVPAPGSSADNSSREDKVID